MSNVFHLDKLRKGCSGIMPSLGSFMCDCAIFSLASQNHLSGMPLTVKTHNGNTNFILKWEGEIDLQMHRTMNDFDRATDYWAMCLAIFFVLNMTNYEHFTFSRKESGVDFWLFKEAPDSADTSKADARLEVSGIRKASKTNTIDLRHKIKKKQVKQSNASGLDVYIAITEFSEPSSLFIKQ